MRGVFSKTHSVNKSIKEDNNLDEYVFELEYDSGFEWIVADYSGIEYSVSTEEYAPEARLSEYYPEGMTKISVKGTEYVFIRLNKI